ncbi:hypothetical protein TA3x_002339 [Tundrisphaera sp. TA3]|uniref:hypothetical protein n=1 Tax=Tundrisphaera sp. TA3 TaxID=3435775 RepID=UPI003EBCA8F3
MRNRVARLGLSAVGLAFAGPWCVIEAGAQQPSAVHATASIKDGFESPRVAWRLEQTDATVKIYAQERTERAAHEGSKSEGFSFDAGVGGGFYYSYELPRIPITDDLRVSMYVRSNRAGAYFIGRVILPADIDPEKRLPSFVTVQSSSYEATDRWQRLDLAEMLPEVERQARVLRASTRRKVSLEGAYLERLVVNLYGGEGETEVYLDELTIAPVSAEVADSFSQASRPRAARPRAVPIADRPRGEDEPLPPLPSSARVQFARNRLTKDGFPWFFTGVRGLGMDPAQLRRAGFDTMFLPKEAGEEDILDAVRSGMLLVPELVGQPGKSSREPDQVASEAATYPGRDAVAFWSIGRNLGDDIDLDRRQAVKARTRETVRAIRKEKPGGTAISTATVLGQVSDYARLPENLDLLGVPLTNWATVQNPLESLAYLNQRRFLTARSNADALMWASIDATPPPAYAEAIWGRDRPPGWGVPQVQPEQIRIAAYAAIAAGCRGLCFNGDASLTQGGGRSNLIELALLNLECDVLEPILADADKTIQILDTLQPDIPQPLPPPVIGMNTSTQRVVIPKEQAPHPTIKAAMIETKDRRGRLLMVADFSPYAQYQPPMAAINNLSVVVPASNDSVAYEITPGGITVRDIERVPGGMRVTLPDFGVSTILLVTTNVDLANQVKTSINNVRHLAVAYAIEQAEIQRAWVEEIDARIVELDHPQKDSAALIAQAGDLVKSARERYEAEDYQMAWEEARRAGRPLRHLMRYHFMAVYDRIIKSLNDESLPCGPVPLEGKEKPQERVIQPIVAAPLASWSTLPQAWIWLDWIRSGRLGSNRMASGDFEFEDEELLADRGWADESYQDPEIQATIKVVKGGADKRGHHLMLNAKPKGVALDSLPPFQDHPVVAVRSPAIKVSEREVYRVSMKVDLTYPTAAGAGGLIIRDSIGGERLQFRLTSAAQAWYEVVFYRRIPADGTMSLMIGLAGYGSVGIDDLRIEPIQETVDPEAYAASRPRRAAEVRTTTVDPTAIPAAPAATRSATRAQPYPVRQ